MMRTGKVLTQRRMGDRGADSGGEVWTGWSAGSEVWWRIGRITHVRGERGEVVKRVERTPEGWVQT